MHKRECYSYFSDADGHEGEGMANTEVGPETSATGATTRPVIAYFDRWTDPVAQEILERDGGTDVRRVDIEGDERAVWETLGAAHGYQSILRTDLARRPGSEQWVVTPAMLARCDQILAVCAAGAG